MKPIVIQGAMAVELQHLRQALQVEKEETMGGYTFYHGNFQGYPVILSQTNIGMVHCAVATTLAITHYHPAFILNQGLAGAHSPKLKTGDIVLGHFAKAINSFEKPLEKEGVHYKKWLGTSFYADLMPLEGERSLVDLFDNAEYSKGQKILGILGSGDVWNREWEFITWLHENMGTHCEDMESQAMYKVAQEFAVPALGLRIISNNELLEEEYNPEIGKNLQEYILEQLPQCVALAKEEPGK